MQTIVGVLRGGSSREHDASLKTGASILGHLPEEKFAVRDVYIDRKGVWHDRGRPTTPERVLRQVDVAVIGLHGEDGQVQRLLERFGVPYTGADSFGSYLAMHTLMAKVKAREAGFLTPEFRYVEEADDIDSVAREVTRSFHQPVVMKPVGRGSSVGTTVVGGFAPIRESLTKLRDGGAFAILIEEFVRGKDATVGIIENVRGEALYALPAVEVAAPLEASGRAANHVVPGNFTRVEAEELASTAKRMHRELGLRHYSRSDFIVTSRGVYYLGTDALPAVGPGTPFGKALESVGIPLRDFYSHLVRMALG